MNRNLLLLTCLLAAACGHKVVPPYDAGTPDGGDDSGTPDAGRTKGEDPPTGFSTAIELPDSTAATLRVGVSASVLLDQFAQPMIACINTDPNGDGNPGDTQVIFTRWNGVTKKYETPVNLATIGDVDLSEPSQQVSLARDETNGMLYVAFVTADKQVRVAYSSDEGATWSLETVSNNPNNHVLWNPQVAAHGGSVHVAWQEAGARCSGAGCNDVVCRMKTGSGAYGPNMIFPIPTGYDGAVLAPFQVAADKAGNPGVVAAFEQSAGMDVGIAFWRPGTSTATVIASSMGTDNSTATTKPSASLAFDSNAVPRVAYHLLTPTANAQLWYAAATTVDGTTWSTPVAMPRNSAGTTYEGTRWYQSLAIDSTGKLAIGANHASSPIPQPCTGGPKIARSSDGTSWTVCRPDTTTTTSTFGFAGEWVRAGFHAPGKVTLGFTYENRSNPLVKGGVVIWRDP